MYKLSMREVSDKVPRKHASDETDFKNNVLICWL